MSLDPLTDFFKRFKHITPPDEVVRKIVVKTIKEMFGVDISIKDVSVKNSIIFINTKPTIKSELFIRKSQFISQIKKEVGENIILKDVR